MKTKKCTGLGGLIANLVFASSVFFVWKEELLFFNKIWKLAKS